MTAAQRRQLLAQIRDAIEASGVQPSELARRSGVDKATLSRFLNGAGGLSVGAVEKLAATLGLTIVVSRRKKTG